MKINDLNVVNTQYAAPKAVQMNDSVSKNIQTQIINAQKKLQDLSSNEKLSMEEKMKRRQEILKEISDLHNRLRQHQLEQRKEKQEMKGSADVLTPFAEEKTEEQKSGLSAQSMMSMISADAAQMQARVQGSVTLKLEGRINVLESEIKLDSMRGNVEEKEEELHKLEEKANKAITSQMETIAEANKQANSSKDEEKEDIKISID